MDDLGCQSACNVGPNSCHGCPDPNCNFTYARSQALRIARENPRCPCQTEACVEEYVQRLMPMIVSRAREHPIVQPESIGQEHSREREVLAPGQRHRSPSPTLEPSYPELVILGSFHGIGTAVAETISLARRLNEWSETLENLNQNAHEIGPIHDFEIPIGPEERYRFF